MSYTFNEAIEKLKALSEKGADTWYGDSLDKHTNVKGHIETGDIETIIYKLQQEYAPMIKMTKEQYKGLLFEGKGRETAHKNFVFMRDVQELNDGYISIDTLMNAFVHPETIKVIDKEDK